MPERPAGSNAPAYFASSLVTNKKVFDNPALQESVSLNNNAIKTIESSAFEDKPNLVTIS
jgi:hypothetical protein